MSGFFGVRAPVVLLLDQSVGSSTSYTIDNTVITRPFVKIELLMASLSHNDAGSQVFRIEISGDNGSNWSSVHAMSGAVSSGGILSITCSIWNAAATGSVKRMIENRTFTQNNGTNPWGNILAYTVAGPINAIRLSPGGSSFDSGTVTLIGYPI